MTHPTTEELSAFLDGELESAEKIAHIESCTECLATITEWKSLRLEDVSLSKAEIEHFVTENLFRRRTLRAQPKSETETSGRWFAAAAAILVVGVGAYITIDVGRTLRESSSPTIGVETMGQNQAALSAGVY